MITEKVNYKITDEALVNIASIERNISSIVSNEINFNSKNRLSNEVLFDDLYAINGALNLGLTLGDVKKISFGREPESKAAQLLSNVKQVFDYIKNNYKKSDIPFNYNLFQHVVKLLQSDILEVWDIGKIRSQGDELFKQFELSNQPYSNDSSINDIAESIIWIEEEKNIHPIVKSVVFLYILNKSSPFLGLNLISSLLMWRIILEKYHYGNNFSIPLFKTLNINQDKLTDTLNLSFMDSHDVTLTDIITHSTILLNKVIKDYKEEHIHTDYYDVKTASNQLDLNDRQIKILKLLQEKVSLRRKDYIKLFHVSSMTAYRDLNFLVDSKMLIISGQGKSTTYTLYSKV